MVSKKPWMLVWLVLIVASLDGRWSEGCLEQERFDLLQIKHFFNDPDSLQNWVEGDLNSDCCQWDGVGCQWDGIECQRHGVGCNGIVIVLNLYGTRNWEMGEWYLNTSLFSPFQQLQKLDLGYNSIAGCIENEGFDKLSTLNNLEELYLDHNNFNSSILSSLSTLSSLKQLSLSNNKLKGMVYLRGLKLRNLEYLDLSGNIFNDNILSSLSALLSLKTLYLEDAGLEGSVDLSEIFDSLSNLEELYMSNNHINTLVVTKDNSSVGLRNLQFLSLENVNIHDGSTLLRSLGSLPYLKRLDLSYNNFSGNVTSTRELHNFTNLEELTMRGASLHTSLLQSISAFTSLERLIMEYCQLNGIMSTKDLSNLKNLKDLSLGGTNLNISILQKIGLLTSLESLSLLNCNIEGTFPDQGGLCELVHLRKLDLSSNNLKGALPSCFGNLTSLQLLDLSSNQFSGNISSSPLKALTSIQELRLLDNHFQIPISLEPFFNHSKLKYFNGHNNQIYAETESHSLTPKFQLNSLELSGCRDCVTFPKFLYHQHDLNYVDLSHNNLTGEFPNWLLDNNTNLFQLVLVNDSFTGPLYLPTHSHQNLMSLDISNNFFHGNIPILVGAYLPRLWTLNISLNDFDGRIPPSIGDMKELSFLDLSYNKLSGKIPEHLAKYLVLSNNSLKGQIFTAANFNLKYLRRLQLDGNHFNGKIPEWLSNSSDLEGLYLSDNHLSGRIPSWLGNMSELVDLIMPNNHLEGPIPPEFCQLQNLEVLNLAGNNISGDLPSRFSPPQIQQVHLSKNKLEGQLKDAFFNSSSLVTLDLGYNCFNGGIPNWIGRLSNLTYLILTHNNLEGEVPHLLCSLEQLRLIDLSHNNLSGQIPHCLDMTALHADFSNASEPSAAPMRKEETVAFTTANISYFYRKGETIEFTTKNTPYSYQGRILTYMSGVDLSCNKLTGEIPYQIGNLTRIHTLNLSYNNLTGSIPWTFSNLEQIESLDLSHNNLNGKIPPQIIELYNLAVFSVAYNNLSDKTPERINQFGTFEDSSYQGNPLLCGLPLPKSCDANGSPSLVPKASTDNEEDSNFTNMDIFYISFTVTYIVVVLVIAIVLYVNPYWRRTWFYLVETWMTSCYYFIIDHLPKGFHH